MAQLISNTDLCFPRDDNNNSNNINNNNNNNNIIIIIITRPGNTGLMSSGG